MSVNFVSANSELNRLSNYVHTLRTIRNSLDNLKTSLNNSWQAEEMLYINNAIGSIAKEIILLSSSLERLKDDISISVYEINREEEERARAAAAAAAALALSKKK